MMKRILFALFFLFCCAALSAQSMKMVVNARGEVVGRYVATNETTYTVEIQDTGYVPRIGNHVVTFRAEDGQGIVYRDPSRTGNINVRKGPSTSTPVVAKIPDLDGAPEAFPCLGKVNGWYKIRIDGVVGFVRGDLSVWDGMCTF